MLRHTRFVIASCVLIGCGGGSSARKDGGPGMDALGSGAHLGTGSGGLGGLGGAGGVGGTAGSGTAGAAMPTGSLVFTGSGAQLITEGPPCSGDAPGADGGTGDRWCGFFAASVSNPGHDDLFVVNVSQAAAGVSITCGLTDSNCLRLTDNFLHSTSTAPDTLHVGFFGGQTLVYYDLTGTPFAWRPGMTAGRMLAVADATMLDVILCTPALNGTGVFCLRRLPMAMQTDPTHILLGDLIAGNVDATASPPLVKVETLIAASSSDNAVGHFEVGFPTPDTIAWSARVSATGAEVLKMQTLGNDASRATIATGVNSWTTSPDGARWYWLSAVSDATGAGTLQSAPFPGGASPVTIAPSVIQFDFPTPTSLLLVDNTTTKKMLSFADPVGAPTTSVSVDTGVLGWIALSRQGHVAYVKKLFRNSAGDLTGIDLSVKKADGTGACVLTTATDAFPGNIGFIPSATGVSWIQQATSAFAAQFTRLSDCTKMTVAPGVVGVDNVGDRGIMFLDGFDMVSGTANMKVQNLSAGALSTDPASLVSGQVGSWAVTTTAGSDVIVYTVNGGGNDDGAYVRSFGP
jgi:hypothetical protein